MVPDDRLQIGAARHLLSNGPEPVFDGVRYDRSHKVLGHTLRLHQNQGLRFIDLGGDQDVDQPSQDRYQERDDDPVLAPLRNVQVLCNFIGVHHEPSKERRQNTENRTSITKARNLESTKPGNQEKGPDFLYNPFFFRAFPLSCFRDW
jgi:hypothetical protein